MPKNYCTQCDDEGKTCGVPRSGFDSKEERCSEGDCTHKGKFHTPQPIATPPSESKAQDLVLQMELLRLQKDNDLLQKDTEVAMLQKDKEVAVLQKDNEIMRLKHSNEMLENKVLKLTSDVGMMMACPTDELTRRYDEAPVVELKFSEPEERVTWLKQDCWNKHATLDASKKETAVIQPHFSSDIASVDASGKGISNISGKSVWDIVDTHNGRDKLTQDALMVLKDTGASSYVCCGLVIELVGQDLTSFPDKSHKYKLLRDMHRLSARFGHTRALYGVITDLSRVQVLKFTGSDGSDFKFEKTAVDATPGAVKNVFEMFINASPMDLLERSVAAPFEFIEGGTVTRPAYVKKHPMRHLGTGAVSSVYSTTDDQFIKVFKSKSKSFVDVEIAALKTLNDAKVPYVPQPALKSKCELALVSSPVGNSCSSVRGNHAKVLDVFVKLVECLEKAHGVNVLHRDIKPANVLLSITLSENKSEFSDPLLIDWSTSSIKNTHKKTGYSGTTYYAASELLEGWSNNENIIFEPKHDLESLVLMAFDLLEKEQLVGLRCGSHDFAVISGYWGNIYQKHAGMRMMVDHARKANYSALKNRKAVWQCLCPFTEESENS